jgi:hypothetical protein
MRVKPQDSEDFSSGEIKEYGGIYAATAQDFADALKCTPEELIDTVYTSDIEPLTAVGDEDNPERYSLSFERDQFKRLRDLIVEGQESE